MSSRVLSLIALVSGLFLLPCGSAQAQLLRDSTFTWKGNGRISSCEIQIYRLPQQSRKTHAIVLKELAESEGPSVLDDARYLVGAISEKVGLDPTHVFWIFHYGAFSFKGAAQNQSKEILLRATFRRTKTGRLTSPSWRVMNREEVEDLTDRQFQ